MRPRAPDRKPGRRDRPGRLSLLTGADDDTLRQVRKLLEDNVGQVPGPEGLAKADARVEASLVTGSRPQPRLIVEAVPSARSVRDSGGTPPPAFLYGG